MRKPNLFIVGAPKCGTTAWTQYLGTHPEIYLTPVKEPHHFCVDFNYRWCKSRDDYLGRPSDALRQEIRAYYEADNAMLERRLCRPAARGRASAPERSSAAPGGGQLLPSS